MKTQVHYVRLVFLIILAYNTFDSHSHWVFKLRAGVGDEVHVELPSNKRGYWGNSMSISNRNIRPFKDLLQRTFQFDAEISRDNSYWINFSTTINSRIGTGYSVNFPNGQILVPQDIKSMDMEDPGLYYGVELTNSIENENVYATIDQKVTKFKLGSGYYFLNLSKGNDYKNLKFNNSYFSLGVSSAILMMTSKKWLTQRKFSISNSGVLKLDDGSFVTFENEFNKLRTLNYGLEIGLNLRFRILDRHEVVAFSIWYEQYFLQMLRVNTYLDMDGVKSRHRNQSTGSCIGFRVSFPVFSYNFTKKKFYRD